MKTDITKKLFLFLVGFMVMGCATGQNPRLIRPHEDPESYQRLVNIGDKVLPVMDGGNIHKYRIGIVDSESVNAWTTGGQNFGLFFTRAALSHFTDDELTFIYAHEVSHVKLGHVEKRIAASVVTSTAFNVVNLFIPGAGLMNLVANPVITSAFSRPQEMDADKLAVEAIYRCCQIPKDVAIRAHEKILAIAKSRGYKEEDRWGILDTHPSLEERIMKIREMP